MENIDDLIQKAKEIGHDTVPDTKPVIAEKKILKMLNDKPTRCFQTKEFNVILRHDEEIRTPSSGMLVMMAEQEKIERVGYGLYRAKIMPEKQSILEKIKLILQKIF